DFAIYTPPCTGHRDTELIALDVLFGEDFRSLRDCGSLRNGTRRRSSWPKLVACRKLSARQRRNTLVWKSAWSEARWFSFRFARFLCRREMTADSCWNSN